MSNTKKKTTKKAPAKKAPAKKASAKKAPAKKQAAKKAAPTKKQAAKKAAAPQKSPKKTKNLIDSIEQTIESATGFDIPEQISNDIKEMQKALGEIEMPKFSTTTTSAGDVSVNVSFSTPASLKKLPWFKRIFGSKKK